MSRLLVVATSLSRRWTTIYTAGLPEGQRSRRRAEIESDVWEQIDFGRRADEASADTGFEILMRTLLGIPSDLFWRHSARQAAPLPITGGGTMLNRAFAAFAAALTVAVGLFLVSNAIGSARGDEWWFFAPAEVLTGALMIAGVFAMNRSPRIATGMIIAGAVGAALAHYWMIVVTVPVALVIILGSLAQGRGRGSAHPKQPV